MEDDLKKKWKMNQSTKINLIGCDTIVNSPSSESLWIARLSETGQIFKHNIFIAFLSMS